MDTVRFLFIVLFCIAGIQRSAWAKFPASITFPYSAPAGAVLATASDSPSNWAYAFPGDTVNVNMGGAYQDSGDSVSFRGEMAEVWKTGNPGIGIAFWVGINNGSGGTVAFKGIPSSRGFSVIYKNVGKETDDVALNLYAELVTLGQAPSTGRVDGSYEFKATDNDSGYGGLELDGSFGDVSVNLPTCQIKTQNVTVPMGNDISMSRFKNKGDTSPQQTLQLDMTCPAGIPKLQYQFAPAGGSSDLGNGTLSLSNPGGASGVGVQITSWNTGDPVPLNTSIPMAWYNGQEGEMKPAWSARYIRTGDQVKGGEADAKATFTLTYQ